MRGSLLFLSGLVFCQPLFSQITLGTDADPCTGGAPLAIYQTQNTVRWSNTNFTCTLPVTTPGVYTLLLTFLEPCYKVGACAAGQITKPGQRIETVFVNDQPVLWNFDPFAAGATDSTPAGRAVMVSLASAATVKVQTVFRSGVLSGVSLTPFAPTPDLSSYALKSDLGNYVPYFGATQAVDLGLFGLTANGVVVTSGTATPGRITFRKGACPTAAEISQLLATGGEVTLCVDTDGRLYEVVLSTGEKLPAGSAPTLPIARATCAGAPNCAQVDLYTFTLQNGTKRTQTAVPATADALAIPACPSPTGGVCWHPALVDQ